MELLEDALEKLLSLVEVGQTVRLPLEQGSGSVLAEDVISDIDFPPFNRSPLDGYAVRINDVVEASPQKPVIVEQIDYVPAGAWSQKKVEEGQATRIMTGAKVPDGADAVVRLEDTRADGNNIEIHYAKGADKNICYQGEEIKKGEVVLSKGMCLREGEISMLALLGYATPLVYTKPRVAILATGSELVAPAEALTLGKIRDTNSYMLASKVGVAGAEAVLLGQVADDIDLIMEKLYTEKDSSIFITTGGASVGDFDLMEELFERLRVQILFKRVAIKPGMPVLAGIWNGKLLIALSGNPAACSVSFELLVRPLLLKMLGMKAWNRPRIKAKLWGNFNKASTIRRFVWARCFIEKSVAFVEPLGYQGNGMLKAMLTANALIDVPEDSPPLADYTEVDVLLLS